MCAWDCRAKSLRSCSVCKAADQAAVDEGAASLGIAGGVSANSRLRAVASARAASLGLPLLIPRVSLSTDNAAMIAAAGLRRFRAGQLADWNLNAEASLAL